METLRWDQRSNMAGVETIFVLLFVAVLLVVIAQKIRVPYPIALVLGGTLLGFFPGLQAIRFNPNVILLIVLPPILYYAAFGIAFREFQKNWREIFSLALGLVAFTTLVIGVIFKWMFPQFSWPLAFAFGAIVSPPDAISATTILKRFDMSPRLVSLLEGESLINDASAIVLYKLSVTALLSGSFSLIGGGEEFIQEVGIGVLVGIVSGVLMQWFSKKYLKPALGVVFSFTIPYLTYILAMFFGGSGVLAVVVNGLIGSQVLLKHHSSLRRVLGYATWDTFILLLNCFVFILIGLQLKTITMNMSVQEMILYTGYALFIAFAMVVVRMFWVYTRSGIAYLKALHNPKSSAICPQILREAAVIGWSGMRGVVSLAVAIALPFTLPNGLPLEGRNEVIFITFVVIMMTLLIPGLTLPFVIRRLKIHYTSKNMEDRKIRDRLVKNAEEKLHHLHHSQSITSDEFDLLRTYFISQHQILEHLHAEKNQLSNIEKSRLAVIQSQRKLLLEMWKQQEIDDRLLIHMESELDIVEIHIVRSE